MTIVSILLLIVLIVFLCLEKGQNRKISMTPFTAGMIYLMFPVIYSIAMTIGIMCMYNSFFVDNDILRALTDNNDIWGFIKNNINWSFVVNLIIQAAVSIPVSIISLAGAFTSARRSCSEYSDKQKWTRLPFASAVISTASATVVVAFAVITFTTATGETVIVAMLVAALLLVLAMVTMGLAILFAIFSAPIIIAGIGVFVFATCLPLILSAYVWCCCFVVLHIISAAMSFYVSIRLKKEGIFTKKNMIINCLLSLIPIVNIISSINTASKIRLYYNN